MEKIINSEEKQGIGKNIKKYFSNEAKDKKRNKRGKFVDERYVANQRTSNQ